MRRLYLHILLIGCLSTPLLSQASDLSGFKAAESHFMQALNDEGDTLEQAIDEFQALLDKEPKHSVYRAYLGASISLQSRDAWMPWNKMKYSERGLAKIDDALKMLKRNPSDQMLLGMPVRFHTKFIAAATFIGMPDDIFHRHRKGKELLESIISDAAYKDVPDSFKASVQNAYRDVTHE